MKLLLLLIVIVLGVLALALFGPSKTTPTKQDAQQNVTNNQQPRQMNQQPRQAAQQQQPTRQGGGSLGAAAAGITTDIGDVVNYGIGATQMKVKRNAQTKLDNINSTHNKDLNDRLNKN